MAPYGYRVLPAGSSGASSIDDLSLPSSPRKNSNSITRRARWLVVTAGVIVLGSLLVASPANVSSSLNSKIKNLSPSAIQASLCSPSSSSSSTSYISKSSTLDPFLQPGQLQVTLKDPDENYWQPWDPSILPSTWLTTLRRDLKKSKSRQPIVNTAAAASLEWLRGRTVAVIGDSIDRDHVEYFCELVSGNMEWIWSNTRYSPPMTYSPGDPGLGEYNATEHGQDGEDHGAGQSRPRVCTVEKYDFKLVFVFHYGLSEGSSSERSMEHFYPPFLFTDRVSSILLPILSSLSSASSSTDNHGAPLADMVEFSTGSWDLQHWTFQDRNSSSDRQTPLSSDRVEWYKDRFQAALSKIEESFGGDGAGRGQTKLVLREIQHTKMTDTVPPPRVHGLRTLQEYVLKGLLPEERRERWEIDNLADLLLGMEMHYRDAVHPNILPAGKLWGDIMLHKLKAHVDAQAQARTPYRS